MMITSTLVALTSVSGPPPVAPVPDAAYAERVNRAARGVGIGVAQGIWGSGVGQRLHLDIPFGRRVGQFIGLRVSGTFVHSVGRDDYDPVGFGGLVLFGRTAVLAGIVRAYGGGGVYAGGRPRPTSEGGRWGVAGGGHVGIEVFAVPRVSFAIEIGGQGAAHPLGLDRGASAMGGVNVYLGRVR